MPVDYVREVAAGVLGIVFGGFSTALYLVNGFGRTLATLNERVSNLSERVGRLEKRG